MELAIFSCEAINEMKGRAEDNLLSNMASPENGIALFDRRMLRGMKAVT